MSIGLVGKKSGMSRLFQEDGTSVPVTVISVAANFVADIKTHEKHGYSAVVVSKNTSKNLTKSSTEFFKKQNISSQVIGRGVNKIFYIEFFKFIEIWNHYIHY